MVLSWIWGFSLIRLWNFAENEGKFKYIYGVLLRRYCLFLLIFHRIRLLNLLGYFMIRHSFRYCDSLMCFAGAEWWDCCCQFWDLPWSFGFERNWRFCQIKQNFLFFSMYILPYEIIILVFELILVGFSCFLFWEKGF